MNDISNEILKRFSSSDDLQITKTNRRNISKLESLAHKILVKIGELDKTDFYRFENEVNLIKEVQKYEIKLIKIALKQSNNNQTKAAKLLRIKKSTLNAKIGRYKI